MSPTRLLRRLGMAAAIAFTVAGPAAAETPKSAADGAVEVTMYRTPTCGCCVKWARHLESAGFEVEINELRSLTSVKLRHGVPQKLASCPSTT